MSDVMKDLQESNLSTPQKRGDYGSSSLRIVSKYKPHQGARECERRRVGGFHLLRRQENRNRKIAALKEESK